MSPAHETLIARGRAAVKSGSKLSVAIVRAIVALEQDVPFTSTVSVPPAVALEALLAASLEKRDFSNFVTVALGESFKNHGQVDAAQAEAMGKIAIMLADQPDLLGDLEKFLRDKRRTRRRQE